jgi:hypothetical protein
MGEKGVWERRKGSDGGAKGVMHLRGALNGRWGIAGTRGPKGLWDGGRTGGVALREWHGDAWRRRSCVTLPAGSDPNF